MDRTRILVVELDVFIRHKLAQDLRGHGCIVLESRNAEEARTLLTGGTIPIDIVVIGAAPADAGSGLAEWIRCAFPATEVIGGGAFECKLVLKAIRHQRATARRG